MKTHLRTTILAVGLFLATFSIVRADQPVSPFGVIASMEKGKGAPIVQFNFEVPPEHVLYPDRLHFETADGQVLTPLTIPKPVLHKSGLTGQSKWVYDHSFAAEIKLDAPLPVDLIVKFQGCSNSACYFPDKRFFRVSSATTVARIDSTGPPASSGAETTVAAADDWQTTAGHFQVVARETGYVSAGNFVGFLQKAKTGKAMSGGVM
ncbi:MAG TPA: protein-disulfide reductase DsbD N-terminal domain-containing protein, partial [Verrucomicrobiae bacterium]|nr:protein-disulfide reductase DsbD N-terminal domain-containing protein [Verrucomicrobiae bacterium]